MSRIGNEAGRGPRVTIMVDGTPLPAYTGETVAAALVAAGRSAWRASPTGTPRGLYCGIGLCFECAVTIDGVAEVRACRTPVAEGMVIETGSAPDGRR